MAFATRLTKIGYHSEHFNERTWMCYHQAPPWERVVAHVRDAGQAKPHREHNPLSLLGACNATPIRKLKDRGRDSTTVDADEGAGSSRGTGVDSTGDDLFARAGLPQQEYWHIRVTDQCDALHHWTQASVGTDNGICQLGASQA